jgi:hypothetical protein
LFNGLKSFIRKRLAGVLTGRYDVGPRSWRRDADH